MKCKLLDTNEIYPSCINLQDFFNTIKDNHEDLFAKCKKNDIDDFCIDDYFYFRINKNELLRMNLKFNFAYIVQLVMNVVSTNADGYEKILTAFLSYKKIYDNNNKKKYNKNGTNKQ